MAYECTAAVNERAFDGPGASRIRWSSDGLLRVNQEVEKVGQKSSRRPIDKGGTDDKIRLPGWESKRFDGRREEKVERLRTCKG